MLHSSESLRGGGSDTRVLIVQHLDQAPGPGGIAHGAQQLRRSDANADILGLTVSTTSSFRVRDMVKSGLGDSGQVVSLVVAYVVPSVDGLRMSVAAL